MAQNKIFLEFKKLTDLAFAPSRGSPMAAGLDLKSAYDLTIQPKDKALVKTDIAIKVPNGCYGRVAPRSGLAHKNFIDVGAGVIDRDYRGNVGVILFNFGNEPFEVKRGDKIAQLILEKCIEADAKEVEELDETVRGEGGFGSTDEKKIDCGTKKRKSDVDITEVEV